MVRGRGTTPFVPSVVTPSLSTSLYAELICLIAVITGDADVGEARQEFCQKVVRTHLSSLPDT